MENIIGRTIHNYRITRELDRGGFGIVYVAEHVTMGKKAVVKQLLPEYGSNPEVVGRFFNEARAAASIDDPRIVQVFDQGTLDDGSAYIIMEFLPGESLAARLKRERRLAPALAVTIARQTARGVAAAHRHGIIHRDLKPENLFLLEDAEAPGGVRIKILDFGIAKLLGDNVVKTQTGMSIGTPIYMPPELWRTAGSADARTDVYALGCILYLTLVGAPPFLGPGLPDLMDQHRFSAPPMPSATDPALASFDMIIRRALAKNPEDRFATMDELAAALPDAPRADLVRTQRGPEPPAQAPAATAAGSLASGAVATPPRRRRAMVLGSIAAVAAITAAVAWLARGSDVPHARGATAPGHAQAVPAPPAPPVPAPASAQKSADEKPAEKTAAPRESNAWVKIRPAPEDARPLLGVATDGAPETISGFRPRRKIIAPDYAYEIQQHEVAFAEFAPWADEHGATYTAPAWVPADAEARARLPAVGVPWELARAYCKSLGGNLPTEAEWEYAARGRTRRPYPWGDEPIDLARTRVFGGLSARPVAVMSSDQDRTPEGITDLLGNAQEWTLEVYRMDDAGGDERWVQANGMTFRAIRGLPPGGTTQALPAEGAASREALCASGPCPKAGRDALDVVGFRCARR